LLIETGIDIPESEITDLIWNDISELFNLSEEFIRVFQDKVIWEYISSQRILSDHFLNEFEHKIFWGRYFSFQESSFQITRKYVEKSTYKTINEIKTGNLSDLQKKEIKKLLNFKYLFSNI
jgi:hypothetical protein